VETDLHPYLTEYSETERMKARDYREFPPFDRPKTVQGWGTNSLIRRNRLLIRPHRSKGLTQGGIYLERNEKHPPTWAHVLAISPLTWYDIQPGDMVIFRRYNEQVLYSEPVVNSRYPGEEAEVAIIHAESVQAVLRPAPVKFRL
jgi:co-chaperonin GroES (HSP10)